MTTLEANRIKSYLEASGMKPSKLGLLACANQYAIDRILEGTATIKTLHSVIAYIEANPVKKNRGSK